MGKEKRSGCTYLGWGVKCVSWRVTAGRGVRLAVTIATNKGRKLENKALISHLTTSDSIQTLILPSRQAEAMIKKAMIT